LRIFCSRGTPPRALLCPPSENSLEGGGGLEGGEGVSPPSTTHPATSCSVWTRFLSATEVACPPAAGGWQIRETFFFQDLATEIPLQMPLLFLIEPIVEYFSMKSSATKVGFPGYRSLSAINIIYIYICIYKQEADRVHAADTDEKGAGLILDEPAGHEKK